MTTVYLIRHAEAEGNVYRRMQGWYDSRVTERGLRQIEALERRFHGIGIDAVYSSDLNRTRRTAEAVADPRGLEIVCLPGLREVCMGEWEDRPWGEAARSAAEQLAHFNSAPEKWDVPGCEPFEVQRERIVSTVRSLCEKHDGETIAVFSHGAILRVLMLTVLGLDPSDISKIPHANNTAVSRLTYEDGEMTLNFIGDASHLDEGETVFAKQGWWKNKSGADANSMWFRGFDPETDGPLYLAARQDAWEPAYGPLQPYLDACLERVKINAARDPDAVSLAISGDDFGGLVELDLERFCDRDAGFIEFYYMDKALRGTSMSLQLMGHAVSVFRGLGRRSLRLLAPAENEAITGYYRYLGFDEIGREAGPGGDFLLMEKDITV